MKALRALYFIFANSVILFLLVVTATHFAVITYYHFWSPSQYEKLSEFARRNYVHMQPTDVDDLLLPTKAMRYQYAEWIGFREAPLKSRFVNIDEYGIRSNGKPIGGIAEIQNAIWFFGGSTTFGYGVTDEETIPAQLEKALGRPVMNFGVGNFYSEQENLALVQYLRLGYRPSIVVFLDGVNEVCGLAYYQHEMKLMFAKVQQHYGWDPLEMTKPVRYAFGGLRHKLNGLLGINIDKPAGDPLICEKYGKRQELRTVHAQILAERESLCRLYALQCRTFVQPFGGVHGRYDDPAYLEDDRKRARDLYVHLEHNWQKAGAEFITNALDSYAHHAYLDEEHYGAAACNLIADAIARRIGQRGKTGAS